MWAPKHSKCLVRTWHTFEAPPISIASQQPDMIPKRLTGFSFSQSGSSAKDKPNPYTLTGIYICPEKKIPEVYSSQKGPCVENLGAPCSQTFQSPKTIIHVIIHQFLVSQWDCWSAMAYDILGRRKGLPAMSFLKVCLSFSAEPWPTCKARALWKHFFKVSLRNT